MQKLKTKFYSHKGIFALIILILFAVAGVYFSKVNQPKNFDIVLTENGFEPSVLIVPKNSHINFKTTRGEPFWPASDPHPLHTKYSQLDPKKPINPDQSWLFKANKVGEWELHDHLFPSYRGKLIVVTKKDWELRSKALTREEISELVDKSDASKAYLDLKKISNSNETNTHSTFHLFGEVLYEKLGNLGISICDEFAGFGCYHGLFVKAVSDKGIDIALDLDKVCIEKFGVLGLGCPHGIGHGLVEFLGFGKLNEALEVCSKLTYKGKLFGCAGGVFMENNFRTVYKGNEATTVIREAHGNLYEPCRSVKESFREACYFEHASWWKVVLNSDYQKISTFCGTLVTNEKEACLLGLGNNIAESLAYNKDEVIKSCSKISDKQSEALCRTGAAWAFYANPAKTSLSDSICLGLNNYQNLCLEKRILVK